MWELRKWGWGPKLPFNSIQPKQKKDNLFILLTKRNMQKLTCYTRWPSQWQLSATCLPLLCSAYMSIGSASKFRLPDFTCCLTQTKIKNQPIGKHSQFDWTRFVQFNLTSRRSCNFSETVVEYFGARQGWPELKRVCKWAPLPLRGNQSTKKIILLQISDHQQGMVVTVTKTVLWGCSGWNYWFSRTSYNSEEENVFQ